jgi:invasion protein IalB
MNQMTERLVVGGAALLLGLILGWAVRGAATYNPAMETVATYQDWRTACPAATAKLAPCEMVEDIVDAKTKSTVARMAISRDGAKPMMAFTLPFGVALEPGIGLVIGKDPVKVYPYRTCNQIGCVASLDFDDKLQAAMKSGTDMRLMYAGLDGKPIGMPLSFKGYNEARRAYTSGESKRASWFWRLWS